MKRTNAKLFTVTAIAAASLIACGSGDDDDGNNNNNNNPIPSTVVRSASLTNVDGTPSVTGSISIRTDAAGKRYIYLGEDFVQAMGPGDTEVRLAKSSANAGDQIAADASNVSPAIGIVPNGYSGARLFEIPSSVNDESFAYAIIWCPTAGVNFGVANLGGGVNRTFTATLTNVDGTPSATGSVTITETGVGMFKLELGADFAVDMGPGDTEIRLAKTMENVADQIAADAGSVSSSVGIVPNGTSGARSFDFSGVEPSDFGFVIIWCPTAGVNFGTGSISNNAG